MKPAKQHEWILQEARKFPGSNVFYKEEWDAFCFFVEGKLFGYIGNHKDKGWILTLKGRPDQNQELREEFSFIESGYHMNKVHWITALVDHSEIKREMIGKLLTHSYDLIFAGLPKKIQAEIRGE